MRGINCNFSAPKAILGEWVEQLVLKDAGLAWAYENGYMSDERISVEADGVRLTVLGTVADPVMTTVVYLVEGVDAEGAGAHISAVNGEGSFSWHDSPVDTPLGKVGMAHTDPLPEGENSVTLQLRSGGKLKSDLQASVTVDREEISRVSREYPLEYRWTMEGVSVEAHRVVYTPTQMLVEYTIAGGGSLGGTVRNDEHIYLLDSKGNQFNSSFRKGEMIEEDVWRSYAVFEWPKDTEDLQMVIPVLGRRELVDVEFTPDSVGKRQELDPGLQLAAWRTNGEIWNSKDILELGFKFEGDIRAFSEWTAVDADGNTHELDRPRWGMTGAEEFYGVSLDSFDPVKVRASEAQVVVRGDWEIPLPGAE
ncbi:MAG: hypothetical protein FH749_16180 [Firmicutes bacterium]|nr:hypothetical protein [Bacillota bacterium]